MKLAALPCLALLLACGAEAPKPQEPPPAPTKTAEAPPPEKQPEPAAPRFPPGEAEEACAKILVVAWQGAEGAEPTVTRDKAAAQARAGELQKKLASGTAFAELAAETDEPKTRLKGGAMGTYGRDNWPEKYAPLKDLVFALGIGETGAVVEHPHGLVIAQRCKVEKVHTRHILVRYKGGQERRGEDQAQQGGRARAGGRGSRRGQRGRGRLRGAGEEAQRGRLGRARRRPRPGRPRHVRPALRGGRLRPEGGGGQRGGRVRLRLPRDPARRVAPST